jgi:hypothetical protein
MTPELRAKVRAQMRAALPAIATFAVGVLAEVLGLLRQGGGKVTDRGLPDDDEALPDEVWYKCPDCDGEGWIVGPDDEDDDEDDDRWCEVDEAGDPVVRMPAHSAGTCGGCDGLGVIEGDVEDMDLAEALGWVRVDQ